ncbi:MAG: hypothetical protein JW982_06285 [Spirochaetes bacterium]|nr:hypothetical protein [Spirochaetota bacterium]
MNYKQIFSIIGIVSLLLLPVNCRNINADLISSDRQNIITEKNKDGDTLAVDKMILINNTWNKQNITDYKQSIYIKKSNGKKTFGWSWEWPNSGWSVKSYPEITCGDKPWDRPLNLRSDFPIKVSAARISAEYKIKTASSGTNNLAFEMWITDKIPGTPESITHEIMIWIDNKGMSGAGKHVSDLTVNNTEFDFYLRKSHGDASGKSTVQWTYAAFIARQSKFEGPLDFTPFIKFLIEQKILNPDLYIANIELGNEIVNGKGYTEVSDYRIIVK